MKQKALSPCLAMLVLGNDPATLSYIRLKERAVQAIGGISCVINLPADTTEQSLLAEIDRLNADIKVDGILLQLPLPEHLAAKQDTFLAAIHPEKDVDGFSPQNRGLLLGGSSAGFVSCAALACMEVCHRYAEPLKGKQVLLVGDSFDLIQPLALLFMNEGCSVQIEPSYQEGCLEKADIAIIEKSEALMVKTAAAGKNALLIDAGFHWLDNRTVGNIDSEALSAADGFLLPVPGGMGPILIAKLMENLCRAARP